MSKKLAQAKPLFQSIVGIIIIDMINLAGVDLNLMTAFEAMMIERNVTHAADRIGLAQPSMSSALARLRTLFNDPLFVRSPVGMRPTERALAAAPHVANALALLRCALERQAAFDPLTARIDVRIAIADYGEFIILPALLRATFAAAPNMRIMCVPFDRRTFQNRLERGEIDLAINVIGPHGDRIASTPLFSERFVGVARCDHPRIGQTLDLPSFLALDHALVAPGGAATGVVDRALAKIGHSRRVAYSGANFASLLFQIAQSDLIACIGERIARQMAGLIGLDIYELPIVVDDFVISMAWAKSTEANQGQSWFRDCVRAVVADL